MDLASGTVVTYFTFVVVLPGILEWIDEKTKVRFGRIYEITIINMNFDYRDFLLLKFTTI